MVSLAQAPVRVRVRVRAMRPLRQTGLPSAIAQFLISRAAKIDRTGSATLHFE
jgi:hypothetical protein